MVPSVICLFKRLHVIDIKFLCNFSLLSFSFVYHVLRKKNKVNYLNFVVPFNSISGSKVGSSTCFSKQL